MNLLSNLRQILQENRSDIRPFLELLQKQDLKKGDSDLLLRKAVENRVPQFRLFCEAIVKKGANINFYDSKDNVSNLMLACQKGTIEMVRSLLSYKQLNVLHSDMRQLNAGFYAIENKSREDSESILKLLLQSEPSLVNRQAANQTLLIAAIRKGKVQIVRLLLEFGADPNWQVPDTGNTALHDAVKQLKSKASKAMSEITRLLLYHAGDPLKKNKQQKTVFDYAQRALQELQRIDKLVREQKQKEQIEICVLFDFNNQMDLYNLVLQADNIFDKYEGVQKSDDLNCQNLFLNEDETYGKVFEKDCDELKRRYDIAPKQLEDYLKYFSMWKYDEIQKIKRDSILPSEQVKKIEKIFRLSKEIRQLERQCIRDYKIAEQQYQNWLQVSNFERIASKHGCSVQRIGSFSTGLWIKHSNIDLILIKDGYQQNSRETLENIYEILKKSNSCKTVMLNYRNVRISTIRIQIQSNSMESRVRTIHVTMMVQGNTSRMIRQYILEQKQFYPMLQPIFYVIKSLTYHYRLSEPRNGGLRTYALILMILSWIAKWNQSNLGKLLIDFLYYFGFYYQYQYYEIPPNSRNQHQNEFYAMFLHIYDPINPTNDAGLNVRASDLQKMFKAAYMALHLNVGDGDRLQTMFQTSRLMLA